MTLFLLAALSLLGPAVGGWLLMEKIWPDGPLGLRNGLGVALGTGTIGTIYFLALMLFNSSRLSLLASECALALLIIASVVSRRPAVLNKAWRHAWNRFYPLIFAVTAMVAAATFVFALDSSRHGGWDALVMWNLKARFIAASNTSPLSALLDPVVSVHPDYPLLLPALLSRGWQYTGSDNSAIPIALALFFTIATIVITIAGTRMLCTNSQSWTAGCILAATPFLLGHGASQYADIVICCFMTAAVVLYTVHDLGSTEAPLPLLAGIAAAAAACTKNEGILFLCLLLASRLTAFLIRKTWREGCRELLSFTSGASLGLLTLAIFKMAYAPPNEISTLLMSTHVVLERVRDARLHMQILGGFRTALNFGQWHLNPLALMAMQAAIAWRPRYGRDKTRSAAFTGAFVCIGMLIGYYLVYLISSDNVEGQIRSSLDRLLLQLWPIAVIVYSVMSSPRIQESQALQPPRALTLRVAGVLAVVASLAILPRVFEDKPPGIVSNMKPHMELSRSEVKSGEMYEMKVTGIAKPQVTISYSLNGKPMGQFSAHLESDGTARFRVSPITPKGNYRFIAVRTPDDADWRAFDNEVAIVVK